MGRVGGLGESTVQVRGWLGNGSLLCLLPLIYKDHLLAALWGLGRGLDKWGFSLLTSRSPFAAFPIGFLMGSLDTVPSFGLGIRVGAPPHCISSETWRKEKEKKIFYILILLERKHRQI